MNFSNNFNFENTIYYINKNGSMHNGFDRNLTHLLLGISRLGRSIKSGLDSSLGPLHVVNQVFDIQMLGSLFGRSMSTVLAIKCIFYK